MGAGYELTRMPLDRLSRWSLHQQRLLCFNPKNSISALVFPTAHEEHADIGPKDDAEFLAHLDKHAPVARNNATLLPNTVPLGSFVFSTRCGLNTKTLSIFSNGMVKMDEKQTGVTSMRELDNAFLDDLNFVRYTENGILQSLFCGSPNRIEISFLSDRFFLDTKLKVTDLPLAFKTVLTAALNREPSPPLKVYEGKIGKLELGPEFSIITTTKMGFFAPLSSTEVIAIKTSDISHLRAALPSWQNALVKAIRDIELYKLSRTISALMGEDLALLPVWPCTFFNDLYLSIILAINALISIFQFIMVFFFRKTAVIFGGPGPAKQVSFLPDENPEALLRSIAKEITTANNTFSWSKDAKNTVATTPVQGNGKIVSYVTSGSESA